MLQSRHRARVESCDDAHQRVEVVVLAQVHRNVDEVGKRLDAILQSLQSKKRAIKKKEYEMNKFN
jgi:hypothetical protein